jgi:hypothetical protein
MKIKFVLVNTDKSFAVDTFHFEANSFKEFKDNVANYWSGGEEIEGLAHAVLENHKDVTKTFDSFDANDEGNFPISSTIRYSTKNGVTTADMGDDFSYKDHDFFKEIDKEVWNKWELEFAEALFNFYLSKS